MSLITCLLSLKISTQKNKEQQEKRKLENENLTQTFCPNFSGASGISRQNPGKSRQKSLVSLVSRDIPNFSAPTPSRGKTPTLPDDIRTQKFGFVLLPEGLRHTN